MFKPKPKSKTVAPIASRDDLTTRLQSAEDRLMKHRAEAVTAAKDNPDKLKSLSEIGFPS